MTKQRKQLVIYGGAGLVALLLLYRWYHGRQTASTGATSYGGDPSQTASDYSSLAGQEQADIAAANGQEQADIAGLNAILTGIQGQLSALQNQAPPTPTDTTGGGWSALPEVFPPGTPDPLLPGGGPIGKPKPTHNHVAGGHQKVNRGKGPKSGKAPKKNEPTRGGAPAKKLGGNTHSSNHQAGNRGHVGGHAGGAVAPRSHNPRRAPGHPSNPLPSSPVTFTGNSGGTHALPHPAEHHQPPRRGRRH